jgi:hypothetical protein
VARRRGAAENRAGKDISRDGTYESDWHTLKKFFGGVSVGPNVMLEEVKRVGSAQ